ncbi:hypothetical protein E2562_014333 [Oryza meyeriana var. granulata]|uniref:Leucine-rich repeat-containing N-terminal plant-type domain-containing protein n=1 Tax=Oryza meyeriana var. granulata TaxID=110450 RepID=A0A6G1C6D8_9ORYZ|nr:hypothetical protein E2562_014333 [Oryza meyeriana var. granulata]
MPPPCWRSSGASPATPRGSSPRGSTNTVATAAGGGASVAATSPAMSSSFAFTYLAHMDGIIFESNEISGLVGQITTPLLALDHLEHLDLSINSLEGPTGVIPKFLGSMRSLRYLNLSGIPFTGMVPPKLGNISKLQYLDLSSMEVEAFNSAGIFQQFEGFVTLDFSQSSHWSYPC